MHETIADAVCASGQVWNLQRDEGTMISHLLVYRRDIAKVVIEIATPRVQKIISGVKVTFPDMLGTIGERKIDHMKHAHIVSPLHEGGTVGLFKQR